MSTHHFQRSFLHLSLGLLLAGFALVGFADSRAAAATVPYSNPFTSSAADFTTTAGTWTLDTSGTGTFTNSISGSPVASSAMMQFTDLGGATNRNFQVTSTFRFTNMGTTTRASTMGFAALAADNNTADSTGDYYLADIQGHGNLRLIRTGSSTTILSQTDVNNDISNNLSTNTDYTLTLTGMYDVDGDLTLDLTFIGGTHNQAISAVIPSASKLTGNYFGFRNKLNNNGQTATGRFDNFNVTSPVPEPTGIALALIGGCGALAMAIRRRRK